MIMTVVLAIESGYYDASELNYECYHGSIKLCDALRLWYHQWGIQAGPIGLTFAGLTTLMWIVLSRK